MSLTYAYPASFPTSDQLLLLKTIMAPKGDFASLWAQWKNGTDLDTVDTSTFRLLPSLYLRIRQEAAFEDEWLGRIKGVYRQGWARNQLLLNSTTSVVKALNQQDIPNIMLKGISLLHIAYKDVGGRMMGDADLLVPKDRAIDACNLMLSLGWKCRLGPDINWFDERNILLYLRATHEKSFHNGKGQIIDLHFISPFHNVYAPQQVSVFWNTAVPVMINGVHCHVLSPEMLFLHVCYHGYRKNRMPSYRWVLDAMRTFQSAAAFNWPLLISIAQQLGFMFHLKMAVHYLTEHLGLQLPTNAQRVLESYVATPGELSKYYGSMHISLFNMGNLPMLWGKFKVSGAAGPVVVRPFQFADYVKETYGLKHRHELLKFYVGKLKGRLLSPRSST